MLAQGPARHAPDEIVWLGDGTGAAPGYDLSPFATERFAMKAA